MLVRKNVIGSFTYRALGAAVLERSVYEGVEHDPGATRQAALVVIASSVAAGIGAAGWHGPRPLPLLLITGIALVTWIAWALIILHVGGRWLPEAQTRVDLGQLLRTVGFAASPGLLQVFAWIPEIREVVFVASWLWMLAAMTVAVRQALDFRSMGRAFAVCGLALGLVLAAFVLLGVLFGPTAV
jgi:hypothetical protein